MMDFTTVQDRLLQAKRDNPDRLWPEVLLRKVEQRAMAMEVRKHREAR